MRNIFRKFKKWITICNWRQTFVLADVNLLRQHQKRSNVTKPMQKYENHSSKTRGIFRKLKPWVNICVVDFKSNSFITKPMHKYENQTNKRSIVYVNWRSYLKSRSINYWPLNFSYLQGSQKLFIKMMNQRQRKSLLLWTWRS